MKQIIKYLIIICLFCSLQTFSQPTFVGSIVAKDISKTNSIQTLPPVLLSFDAIINGKKVELTWASNLEKKSNIYTLEKSKDAVNFEKLTTISSFGNNSALINYFDVDYIPYSGVSYYRLKQIDPNGVILSSRIVSVNYRFGDNGLEIFPNSIEDRTGAIYGSDNKEVLVVLRDYKGIESYSKVIIDHKNAVIFSSETEKALDDGIYLIIATSNNKLYSQQIDIPAKLIH